ncbi:Nucleoside 5-triphosphatase RdgB (dHAPTP, dITP, XTP-specific) [hydrothermal vent metagenome]|uniref:dITP/XTP pyrophosphatase n=1 Tax=hydrothermal vent metagenome TaxID=652676 RepID=A0A3B1DWI1_9ZZZZ
MKEFVIATTNQGKMREIRGLLADFDFKITSLADYPEAPEVVEDGKTFRANAIKKARTIAMYTKKLTLGEDSGLEVKVLDNAPGIYSARFSGPQATDKKNNAKLLRELRGVPLEERRACYRCCAVIVDGTKKDLPIVGVANGRCHGLIALRAKGKNGFGYDPYFFLPRYNQTFGQLDPAIKAKSSHRAQAFEKIKKILNDFIF